jgi:hypothetical protein
MAVTFIEIPQKYAPSDNPVMYQFSSTNTLEENFYFLVETYVNGVIVSTDKVFTESGTSAHFDASTITRYIAPQPTMSTVISSDSGTMRSIYLKVIEYYGATPVADANATSTTTYIFKACLSDEDWITSDFENDYQNTKFLTNYPRTERVFVLRSQDVFLNMITDSSVDVDITFYNSAGGTIDTYNDTQNFKIWQLNLKSTLLDAIVTGGIASVAYFTVTIDSSDPITFEYYDDYCNIPYGLLWLNEFGAYDTFVFTHNNVLSASVSSESYVKMFGQWVGSTFTYDLNNSGAIDFSKTVKEKGELTSGYMIQELQNWLVELYKSPFVLLLGLGGYSLPITLESKSYKIEQDRFEDLISETVRYIKSTEHRSLSL